MTSAKHPSSDDTADEDEALLHDLRSDDEGRSRTAMAHIVRLHSKAIQKALLRVVDYDTAADIGQDLMIDLWNRRATIQMNGPIRAYLLGAVHLRLSQRRRNMDTAARCLEASIPYHRTTVENDALDEIIMEDGMRIVHQEYQRASDTCQEIFQLSFYDAASHAEIATTLNIHLSTVYRQLRSIWLTIEQALIAQGLFEAGEIQRFLTAYATSKDGHRA